MKTKVSLGNVFILIISIVKVHYCIVMHCNTTILSKTFNFGNVGSLRDNDFLLLIIWHNFYQICSCRYICTYIWPLESFIQIINVVTQVSLSLWNCLKIH